MASPVFKRTLRAQPQGAAQLDRSNPLTRQAAFVTLGSLGREIVNNLAVTPSGTTPPVVQPFGGKFGSGLASNFAGGGSAASYLNLGANGQTANISQGPATYVAVFYAASAAAVSIAERNDNNSVNAGWLFGYTTSLGVPGLGFLSENSTTNTRKVIQDAISTTGPNVLVVTYDGGLLAAGINIYLNGVLGTVPTSGSNDGAGTKGSDLAQSLFVGRTSFGVAQSHTGKIVLAGAFRRIWSPGEIKSFSDNPWQLFQAPGRVFTASAATNTAALTGNTATGSPGTVAPNITIALTGNAAAGAVGTVTYNPAGSTSLTGNTGTGSAGTVTPAITVPSTGNAGTGSVGTVAPTIAVAVTGNAATGSPGTVTPAITVALTGNAATGAVGTVSPSEAETVAITGNAATGSPGTVTPNITVALTGNQATGAVGNVTYSTAGAATLTGNAATGSPGTVAPAITVALTGNNATGSVGTVAPTATVGLTGNAGTGAPGTVKPVFTIALTGNEADGDAGNVSPPNSGALSGNEAEGDVGTVKPSITVAITGNAATGAVGTVSTSASASAALTGNAAAGAVGTVAPTITVALTGNAAVGAVGTVVVANADITIALTGVQGIGQVGSVTPHGGVVPDDLAMNPATWKNKNVRFRPLERFPYDPPAELGAVRRDEDLTEHPVDPHPVTPTGDRKRGLDLGLLAPTLAPRETEPTPTPVLAPTPTGLTRRERQRFRRLVADQKAEDARLAALDVADAPPPEPEPPPAAAKPPAATKADVGAVLKLMTTRLTETVARLAEAEARLTRMETLQKAQQRRKNQELAAEVALKLLD